MLLVLLSGSGGDRVYKPEVLHQGDDSRVLCLKRNVPRTDREVRRREQVILRSCTDARYTGEGLGSVGRLPGVSVYQREVSRVCLS